MSFPGNPGPLLEAFHNHCESSRHPWTSRLPSASSAFLRHPSLALSVNGSHSRHCGRTRLPVPPLHSVWDLQYIQQGFTGQSSSLPKHHDSLTHSLDLEHQGQWGQPSFTLCADSWGPGQGEASAYFLLEWKAWPLLLFKVHGVNSSLRS